jgi:hypothetical protein
MQSLRRLLRPHRASTAIRPGYSGRLGLLIGVLALVPGALPAQNFNCVLLNDDNTNIFVQPDECFILPEHQVWCNCVNSLFLNPVRGAKSGFSQAFISITDQPGLANHHVLVPAGTLDLSLVRVNDVIGRFEINELIPESVGVPPGTFFTVRGDIIAKSNVDGVVDFDIIISQVSLAALVVLTYDPTDAEHSNGLLYRGRLSSRGADRGFTVELRYPRDLISTDPPMSPAVSVGDQADPGFTVRSRFRYFTTESGIYTLPDTGAIEVESTLRKFSENGLDEILDIGDDLCTVRDVEGADPEPCKVINEELSLKRSVFDNSPPSAAIVVVNADTAAKYAEPIILDTQCGRARAIFIGRNSDDGDGGAQRLSYEWKVLSGPEGGALIPEETKTFIDTEITFVLPGDYEIGLSVADDGAAPNTDETQVSLTVDTTFDVNIPPIAVITSEIDPPEVELVAGVGRIRLDGSTSANGNIGEDDCGQTLSYAWRQTEGPQGEQSTIIAPTEAVTEVEFTFPGTYTIELEVDDGGFEESTNATTIDIEVSGEPLPRELFRRGDVDGDGQVNITDPINALGFFFLGAATPACLDSVDADDSGETNITDAIVMLQFLFLGAADPAPPGPETCGQDVAEDSFAECVYESC